MTWLTAMLVFDNTGPVKSPAHFVLIGWSGSQIVNVRDFLFAPMFSNR